MANTFTRLQYTKDWTDAADFPTREYSEAQVRADVQRLFNEIRTYVNSVLIPQLESGLSSGGGSGSGGGALDSDAFLLKSGGQMTGPLLLDADPEYVTEAATKRYVDNLDHLTKEGLDGEIASLLVEIGKIQATVRDTAGNVSQLTMTPEEISAMIQDALGNMATLKLTSDEIVAEVINGLGDTSHLGMTAEEIEAWVRNNLGDLAKLLINSDEIQAMIQSHTGAEASVTMTPEEIKSKVKDAEDNFSELIQTSTGIDAIITSALGELTKLSVEQGKISGIVEGLKGSYSSVTMTENDIAAIVRDEMNSEALFHIMSDKIMAQVRSEFGGATMTLTDSGLETRVENLSKQVAEWIVKADQITARVSSDLSESSLDMTDDAIKAAVEDLQGKVAQILINSDQIQQLVEDDTGSTSLTLDNDGIEAQVNSILGKLGLLALTDESFTAEIIDKVKGTGSELNMTDEQIEIGVSAALDEFAKTIMKKDGVETLVKNATSEEALWKILSDKIMGVVKDEVSQAGLDMDVGEIKLWVQKQISDSETKTSNLYVRSDSIGGVVQSAMAAAGMSMTDSDFRAWARKEIDDGDGGVRREMANLYVKADEIGAIVQSQMSKAGFTMTDSEVRSYVEQEDNSVVEQILSDDSILDRVSEGLTEEAIIQIMKDNIRLQVTNEEAGDNATIAVNLQVGDENKRGTALVTGNVNVSGTLSAQALTAERGDIARLTVDALSTDRRPTRFLHGDTSDITFLRMHDQTLELVAGINASGQTQYRDASGTAFYWEENVNGLSAGSDGYPRSASGNPVYMTTTVTPWPVYCFQYTEQVKASWSFQPTGNGGIYEPVLTMGAGNAAGGNKARIYKGTEGLEIRYTTPTNSEIGIHMTTDGKVRIDGLAQESVLAALGASQSAASSGDVQSAVGLKRATNLNFSGWESGTFTETLEGEDAARTYGVGFDELGRPVAITDAAGSTLSISW